MKKVIKYEVSTEVVEQLLKSLSSIPWVYVNDSLNLLRENLKPIFEETPMEENASKKQEKPL